jgi:porphobilinogen synthase
MLTTRPRRLRRHPGLRTMLSESRLTVQELIHPLFIHHGLGVRRAISSMPGHYQLSVDQLDEELTSLMALNIPAVILFGLPAEKDPLGDSALNPQGVIPTAIRYIKSRCPDLVVISDLCFCEYTSHGHCGILSPNGYPGEVDNDATLPRLAEQAVLHAQAGVDIVAPSGMLDGMVQAIRTGLDAAGFSHLAILSYAVKYASSLYGPFREAAQGAPQLGDRKTYQMNPANASEALREAALDVAESADMLMVKPAQFYLDIIYRVKQAHPSLPLVAYQVSGEYAMIKAAAAAGVLDEQAVMLESLVAIKRAGADLIITYFAKQFAQLFSQGAKKT